MKIPVTKEFLFSLKEDLKMSDKKCYSTNNEDFNYSEMDDAISDAIDDPTINVGDIVTVYEGDAVMWKAGEFTGFMLDAISNCAADEAGEYSDDWPNCTKEQEADLDKRIADVVNQWANDHGLQPNFYRVQNVKEIQAKFIGGDDGYELLEI